MKKHYLSLLILSLLSFGGCGKLFSTYCDRVAKGTADRNWINEEVNASIPFSKVSYRNPAAGTPGAVCVTAQGLTAETAAGKNFSIEIADANEKVLVKQTGKSAAQPINTENQPKLWSGKDQTNKSKFESTECFNIQKLDPYVKVKVKRLSSGEIDESKLWNNAAYCQDRHRQSS